jgi:hypothetical protein
MATTNVVKDQALTLFGDRTPRAVIYKSESHKLHQAFNVAADKTIVQGMPVQINSDGLIEPYLGAEGSVYLGIAVTDNVNPAYQGQRNFPVEVTVMVEAYAICNWVAKAALDCGYVKPTADLLNDRFVIAEASADGAETKFIAISPADEANDVIQVLIR